MNVVLSRPLCLMSMKLKYPFVSKPKLHVFSKALKSMTTLKSPFMSKLELHTADFELERGPSLVFTMQHKDSTNLEKENECLFIQKCESENNLLNSSLVMTVVI